MININKEQSFDNYIVGRCNQFAFACAHKVAEEPGYIYNPLFIYGESGTGKTHLMNAIGLFIQEHNPYVKIMYLTAEQFAKDTIDTSQNNSLERNKKFDCIDVLMIDGIQYIAGKEAAQEEFFKVFNRLWRKNKQIILVSDKEPWKMQDLEGRVYSRFVRGIVVETEVPDDMVKVKQKCLMIMK